MLAGPEAIDVLPCRIARCEGDFVWRDSDNLAILRMQRFHILDCSAGEQVSSVRDPRDGIDPWSWDVVERMEVQAMNETTNEVKC